MRLYKSIVLVFVVAVLLLVVSPGRAQGPSQEDTNRDLILSYARAELERDYARFDDLLTEDFIRHCSSVAAPTITDRDAFKAFIQETATIFPDYENTIEMLVVDDNMAAGYVTFSGTFVGGEHVEFPFMAFWRIEDNRIAELWVEWNDLVMMPQMGLLPSPEVLMTPPLATADITGIWKLQSGGFYIQYNGDGTYHMDSTLDGVTSDQPDDSGVFIIQNGLHIVRSGANTQSCSPDEVGMDQINVTGEGILELTQVLDTCSWRSSSSNVTHKFVRVESE